MMTPMTALVRDDNIKLGSYDGIELGCEDGIKLGSLAVRKA